MSPPFASILTFLEFSNHPPKNKSTQSNIPFRIDVIQIQIRANVSFLGSFSVLDGPAHAEMGPGIVFEVFDFIILVAGALDHLLIVQRRPGPDGVDATGIVVFVP